MAENYEIFDTPKITELALKWKALTAEGRHGEAMPILEEIIKLCEQMFLRLAQYEGFHHTVDIDTLVQSAREKVPRWLISWDPKFKSANGIFSWLSKCHSSDTRIFLADGTLRRIDEIVDNQQPVDVLVRNKDGSIGTGRVTGWFRQLSDRKEFRKLSIAFRGSKKRTWRCLYVTHEHPIWHAGRNEMVPAEELEVGAPLSVFDHLASGSQLAEAVLYENLRVDAGVSDEPDFSKKYDITVEGHGNFLAEGVVVSNCSKHAFLSEIAKLNQHRKRFHATSDNLEKFFGTEDHNAFRDEAADDVRHRLQDVTTRWGDPQQTGAVRYILECLVEDRDEQKPDKETIIRSAAYAWCINPELTRFFYDWALFALRDALYDKIRVPFTQQDILRHRESYGFLVDVIDIVGWDRFKRLVVSLGGQRIKLPTLQQLARLHQDYLMSMEIDRSELDPDAVEEIGKKHGRSGKTAQEAFEEMVETLNPNRAGEYGIYPEHE
jgi:hypothetical protein